MKRIAAWFLVLTLMLGLAVPAYAADDMTADKMSLTETEGKVTVRSSAGRAKSITAGDMRLFNGDTVETGADGKAYISLGSNDAVVKLSKSSKVEIRKNGEKLEVGLLSGEVFFSVPQRLKSTQSINICAATMVTGIVGTAGWQSMEGIGVLEGTVQVGVFATSATENTVLSATEQNLSGWQAILAMATRIFADVADGKKPLAIFPVSAGERLTQEDAERAASDVSEGRETVQSAAPAQPFTPDQVSASTTEELAKNEELREAVTQALTQAAAQNGTSPIDVGELVESLGEKQAAEQAQTAQAQAQTEQAQAQQAAQIEADAAADKAAGITNEVTFDASANEGTPTTPTTPSDGNSGSGGATGGSYSSDDDDDDDDDSSGGGSAPVTLYYSVNFMDGDTLTKSTQVAGGTPLTAAFFPTVAREGYTLAGWCTDAALTNTFAAGTAVMGNLTLYAKWVKASSGGSGDLDGGIGYYNARLTGNSALPDYEGNAKVYPWAHNDVNSAVMGGVSVDLYFNDQFTVGTLAANAASYPTLQFSFTPVGVSGTPTITAASNTGTLTLSTPQFTNGAWTVTCDNPLYQAAGTAVNQTGLSFIVTMGSRTQTANVWMTANTGSGGGGSGGTTECATWSELQTALAAGTEGGAIVFTGTAPLPGNMSFSRQGRGVSFRNTLTIPAGCTLTLDGGSHLDLENGMTVNGTLATATEMRGDVFLKNGNITVGSGGKVVVPENSMLIFTNESDADAVLINGGSIELGKGSSLRCFGISLQNNSSVAGDGTIILRSVGGTSYTYLDISNFDDGTEKISQSGATAAPNDYEHWRMTHLPSGTVTNKTEEDPLRKAELTGTGTFGANLWMYDSNGAETLGRGKYGNLSWTYAGSSATLTITGTGAMPDTSDTTHAPWCGAVGNTLTTLSVGSGVTSIGNGAFSGCGALASVSLPTGVTSIGEDAFGGCVALKTVNYGGTKAQWEGIEIGAGNQELAKATIKCTNGTLVAKTVRFPHEYVNQNTDPADSRNFMIGDIRINGETGQGEWDDSGSETYQVFTVKANDEFTFDLYLDSNDYAFGSEDLQISLPNSSGVKSIAYEHDATASDYHERQTVTVTVEGSVDLTGMTITSKVYTILDPSSLPTTMPEYAAVNRDTSPAKGTVFKNLLILSGGTLSIAKEESAGEDTVVKINTLCVNEGTISIGEGCRLVNGGTLNNRGEVTGDGTLVNYVEDESEGTILPEYSDELEPRFGLFAIGIKTPTVLNDDSVEEPIVPEDIGDYCAVTFDLTGSGFTFEGEKEVATAYVKKGTAVADDDAVTMMLGDAYGCSWQTDDGEPWDLDEDKVTDDTMTLHAIPD